MLLFNFIRIRIRFVFYLISKHPMLLFNNKEYLLILPALYISKHPMLLFNPKLMKKIEFKTGFQNILCYCLTKTSFSNESILLNFKTSYVTV